MDFEPARKRLHPSARRGRLGSTAGDRKIKADQRRIRIGWAVLLLEEGFSGREVQLVHMRLAQPQGRLAGRKEWPHFPLPKERGRIRVSEVVAASKNMRAQAIESWCRSVWEAWEGSHQAVADWVRRDLGDLRKQRLPPKSGRTPADHFFSLVESAGVQI